MNSRAGLLGSTFFNLLPSILTFYAYYNLFLHIHDAQILFPTSSRQRRLIIDCFSQPPRFHPLLPRSHNPPQHSHHLRPASDLIPPQGLASTQSMSIKLLKEIEKNATAPHAHRATSNATTYTAPCQPSIPPIGHERSFTIKSQRQQATPQYFFPQASQISNESQLDALLPQFTTAPKQAKKAVGMTRDQYNFHETSGYQPQYGIYTQQIQTPLATNLDEADLDDGTSTTSSSPTPRQSTPFPLPFSDLIAAIGNADQMNTSKIILREKPQSAIDQNGNVCAITLEDDMQLRSAPIARMEDFIQADLPYIPADYHDKLVQDAEAMFSLFDVFSNPTLPTKEQAELAQAANQLGADEILSHVDFNAVDFDLPAGEPLSELISPTQSLMILQLMRLVGISGAETGVKNIFAQEIPFANSYPSTLSSDSSIRTSSGRSTEKSPNELDVAQTTDETTPDYLQTIHALTKQLSPYNEISQVHIRHLLTWINQRSFFSPLLHKLESGCQRTLVDSELQELVTMFATIPEGFDLPEFQMLADFSLTLELRTFLFQDFALVRSEYDALKALGLNGGLGLSSAGDSLVNEAWFPTDSPLVTILYTYLIHLIETDVSINQYSSIVQFVQWLLYLFDAVFESTILLPEEHFHYSCYKQYWYAMVLDKYKDGTHGEQRGADVANAVSGPNSTSHRPKYWVSPHLTQFQAFLQEQSNAGDYDEDKEAMNNLRVDKTDHDTMSDADMLVRLEEIRTSPRSIDPSQIYTKYHQELVKSHPFLPLKNRLPLPPTTTAESVISFIQSLQPKHPNATTLDTTQIPGLEANPHLSKISPQLQSFSPNHVSLFDQLHPIVDDQARDEAPLKDIRAEEIAKFIQRSGTAMSIQDQEYLENFTDEQLRDPVFLERYGEQLERYLDREVQLQLNHINPTPPTTASPSATPITSAQSQQARAIQDVQLDLADFVFRPSEHYGLYYLLRLCYMIPHLRLSSYIPAELSSTLTYQLINLSQWLLQQNEMQAQARIARQEQLFRLRSFYLFYGLKSKKLRDEHFGQLAGRVELGELILPDVYLDQLDSKGTVESNWNRTQIQHHEMMRSKEASIRAYIDELRNFKQIARSLTAMNKVQQLFTAGDSTTIPITGGPDLTSGTVTQRVIQQLRHFAIDDLRTRNLHDDLPVEYPDHTISEHSIAK